MAASPNTIAQINVTSAYGDPILKDSSASTRFHVTFNGAAKIAADTTNNYYVFANSSAAPLVGGSSYDLVVTESGQAAYPAVSLQVQTSYVTNQIGFGSTGVSIP